MRISFKNTHLTLCFALRRLLLFRAIFMSYFLCVIRCSRAALYLAITFFHQFLNELGTELLFKGVNDTLEMFLLFF